MTTVRQAIQAKIDTANAASAALSQEIATEDAKFAPSPVAWLDEDPVAFAQKVAEFEALVAKHA